MNSKLFIANKIKVGFNYRPDTYTGKLGYVIGHDGKKWRKEPSWEGWRQKEGQEAGEYVDGKYVRKKLGADINPVEFDNLPTEGFVLNKKAGGYSSGWNARATYCRVYDPRGFEFEISIPNLLFILGECNAMKGKGLEGTFVYSWDGKDLVLLPTNCNEYQQSTNFTQLQSGKVGVKDLVEGCTYKNKQLEEFIYLGKFNWFVEGYDHTGNNKLTQVAKNYTFMRVNKSAYDDTFLGVSGLSNFVQRVTETPIDTYASLLDEFNKSKHSGVLTDVVAEEYKPVETMDYYRYGRNRDSVGSAALPIGDNKYELYEITGEPDTNWINSYNSSYKIKSYSLAATKVLTLKPDGDFDLKTIVAKNHEKVSKSDLLKMNLKVLKASKNNKQIKIHF